MGKVAFVFSGQGDQYPGMGRELCERYPAAAQVFALCDRVRPGTSCTCFEGSEEELKELKSSIASLQENYRSNLVAVTRLQAETQNDQLQLDDVSRRVLEIQEEEKRLMQVLQEKEAFNASRRSEVDQQKQGVLVAKQVLAEISEEKNF